MKKPRALIGLCLLFAALAFGLTGCGSGDDNHEPYIVVDEQAAPHREPHQSGDIEVMEQTIRVALQVPSPAWSVTIEEVWVVGRQIWAICKLNEAGGPASQVISQATDSVSVRAPGLPVTYYVIGRKFEWVPDEANLVFIKDKQALAAGLKLGQRIYPEGA